MTEDMRALEKNQILELIPLPKRKKPVRCIWVFTIKRKPDGMVDKYKTRLVARGFTQTYGIDYQEETGMLDCKPVNTPIEQNHDLEESSYHTLAIKERYHSENHVDAVMRILQYLKFAGKVLCSLGMLQDIQTSIEVGKELNEGLLLATSHLWEARCSGFDGGTASGGDSNVYLGL
ncbi:unnamed protein product [Prunus armeniaca]